MSDLPKSVQINEEGPREGFQIEPGPIATQRKIALIDALSGTGLDHIQVASFVNPKRVPGWADADAVVSGFTPRQGVDYTPLWLNERGIERALGFRDRLHLVGSISMVASEPFLIKNQERSAKDNLAVQRRQIALFKQNGIPVTKMMVMAAFGCNYAGTITVAQVLETVSAGLEIAEETGVTIEQLSLADTMAWATPQSVERLVGAVRGRWPDLRINLHLHDTRGLGIANAYAGLAMGVDSFDAAVAGLGGCPFAGHKGAAGNVCTEDLVFLCEEMGISTGVDLDALIEVAKLAEEVVGHPLPGSVMRGGTLAAMRRRVV